MHCAIALSEIHTVKPKTPGSHFRGNDKPLPVRNELMDTDGRCDHRVGVDINSFQ